MKATITVGMNNAAFDEAPGLELARILRMLAERLENALGDLKPTDSLPLLDVNGNRVGSLSIE